MNVRYKAALAGASLLGAILVAAPLADAQAPAPTSGVLAPDPTPIWTLQGENATLSTAKLTDRYYVNGIRLGFTSGTESVPTALSNLAGIIFGAGQTRYSVDITQQIYTPSDTTSGDPPQSDRPYAGLLLANLGLLQDTATTRSTLGLSVGILGPDAQGERVQNGFHDLIGQNRNFGWNTQLRDEPVFEVLGARTWRKPIGTVYGLETDALLDASAGLGTIRIYGEGGAQIRIGQGLNSDFGTARLRPGISGGDVFRPTRPWAWYAFAGLDGQGVGRDVTLDGNNFRDSRSVSLKPFLAEFQGGFAVMAYGMRLSYTHVVQTQEFNYQKGGLHQFGSLALSVRF